MKLLLDTHALLWSLSDPDQLDAATRRRIESPENVVFASAVSVWEIEIKRALGKLRAPDGLAGEIARARMTELPLHVRHVERLRGLPSHHRDPFDRMLVSQALADGLTLVTRDAKMRGYGVTTLPA